MSLAQEFYMILYAIQDSNTKLYYNYKTKYLDELGAYTQLFPKREDAMRYIEGLKVDGYDEFGSIGTLADELAWQFLEKREQTFRWNIAAETKEFRKIKAMFPLRVVEVTLFD